MLNPFHLNDTFQQVTSIFNSSNIGAIIYDAGGRIEDINSAAMHIVGIFNKSLLLQSNYKIEDLPFFDQMVAPDGSLIFGKSFEYCYNPNTSEENIREMNISNDVKWFMVKLYEVHDENGKTTHVVVSVTDITSVKRKINIKDQLNLDIAELMKEGGISTWKYDIKTRKRTHIHGYRLFPDIPTENDYYGVVHPEDIPTLRDLLNSLLRGEKAKAHTIIRFYKGIYGHGFKYMDFFCMTKYKDGIPSYIACTAKDVTDIYEYQQQLELEQKKVQLAIEAADIMQFDYEVESDVCYVRNEPLFPGRNMVLLEEYGNLFNFSDKAKQVFAKMRAGEDESINITFHGKLKDHDDLSEFSFVIVPVKRNNEGKVTLYAGLRVDKSKESGLIDALEDSNSLFEQVTNHLPVLFFVKNVMDDFRYSYVNKLYCDSIGLAKEQIEGHTVEEIFTKDKARLYRADDLKTLKEGRSMVQEDLLINGRIAVFQTVRTVITTVKGRKLILGISSDITQLDEALKELEVAKNSAERSDKLKSSFLANMSHEIRTPLNSIIGFSDLLIASEEPDEKAEFGKIISDNGSLLLHLINEILDLSKIEAGTLSFKPTKVDIVPMFEEFRLTYGVKMKENVKFICENPYKKFVITADIERFKQIVNNYVSNAIKYTPEGYIKLGYSYSDGGLLLYVQDSGIGIDEENKPKVFGRFNKLDNYAQGTGLGLSICKAIAERGGGKVGFESELNVGSRFWIWMPTEVDIEQ